MNCCLVSSDVSSAQKLFSNLSKLDNVNWTWVKDKNQFLECDFTEFDQIFVFRWPFIIDETTLMKNNFIGFHTSNLPDGKGGSPLQNQIMDGIYQSKVNAIKLVSEVDGGPVYLSSPITLQGTIEDVWSSIALIAEDLIKEIIKNDPTPQPQLRSDSKIYKRRKNNNIQENELNDVNSLFRFIQMLDGEGYPNAFIECNNFKYEFSRSTMKHGSIVCDVKISRKEKL